MARRFVFGGRVRVSILSGIRSYLHGDDLTAAAYLPAIPTPAVPVQVRGQFDPNRQPEWLTRRAADWSIIDRPAVLLDAVRKSGVVFACGTYLADAVAEAPIRVYRTTAGTTEREIDDSRSGRLARAVLAKPNPFMDESEFWALVVFQMSIQGYGVIEKVRSGAGLPLQLWPLRPDWLRKKPDGSGDWLYRTPRKPERTIPDADVIIVPYRHDDRMERYGIGPVQVVGREIGIDVALTDFLKVFLDAGGIPPFVMTHPDPIGDEAVIEAIQTRWQQKYGGSQAYGTLPALHGGWDIKPLGGSLDDMAWPDLRGITELKIAQAFRVPADLIEARETLKGGSLTTTEMDGAMERLQRYGAQPLRDRIDGAMTRGFLTEFVGTDDSYSLGFDISHILALQEDVDKRHDRARKDWDAGGITLDEYRVAMGLDALPNKQGQVFKVAFSTLFVPMNALTGSPPPPIRAAPRYRDRKALSPAELEVRASLLTTVARDRQRLTEIGGRALRTFWRGQGARIVAELGKAGPAFAVKVAEAINWAAEEAELRKVLMKFYDATGKAAFASANGALGTDTVWEVTNPKVSSLLTELAGSVVGITETTRLDVSRVVTTGLQEGLTLPQVAERLTGLFEETYKGRAMTVARTESQIAYNTASVLAYQESGEVNEVELHDNPDHTEAYGASDGLTCAQRDGLVVKLDAVSRHVAGEHPNGSLSVLPILATPLGEA